MVKITLADTSVRLYRKKSGEVSVRLRSYLMVKTNVGFRLHRYLKNISCFLTFPPGNTMEFEHVSYTDLLECAHQHNTMVHGFLAAGVTEMAELKSGVGKLRLTYWLSFTGHSTEKPQSIQYFVPIVPIHVVPKKHPRPAAYSI